ncbi:MAG: SnoaL-like domain-containing protein [Tateyamaria sp.]|jgi:ketosteroid isomerase-like protein|nr:SnoaL-like domain-containing protein [Tateyamaria sp.]MBT6267415.1 SnoaL-like domain-containing protein [Tateyamaria sp.]MBT6342867.1 SnoaL-like domain-containing protein [Tateyamaria sp.]MBT7447888.1 SnoaL-like domain-containing protein [Tateyamaria sp.]MBT7801918.1 SnoaL-like domain-containing protein [Tateyamaria sp.]|tara:strand:+ start:25 stop:402 length:378 start_codon:yes stop_codon:yes gene_type:complete
MTPKEVMQKTFDCFESGDMEVFQTLHTDDVVVTMNGSHSLSGTYNGFADFIENMIANIPSTFPENFSVTPESMMAEGNMVFTHAIAKGDGLDAYFGFRAEVDGGAIKRLWIYADSQKLSNSFQGQ